MRCSPFRHMLLFACLSAPFLLVGCGAEEGVPQTFPPLRYTYLAPISLNVAAIQTDVEYAPAQDGSSLDGMSPESPLQAVQQMIQDRLVAAGGSGTATIVINSASINRVGDTAVGNISLRLTVTSADGHRTGYTDATVTRTRTMPDDTSEDALRAFLYGLTQDLVNAENVELEYQIRQNLAVWLVGGGSAVIGGPAAPTPVQAEPLGGPGQAAPVTGTGAPTPLGAPQPLGLPTPASMAVPSYTPAVPPAGAPTPLGTPAPAAPGASPSTSPSLAPTNLPEQQPDTMPGSDLGIPQGNPVPPDSGTEAPAMPGAPVPLTPPPSAAPSPAYQLVPTQPPAAAPSTPPAPAPAPAAAPPPPAPPAPKPAPPAASTNPSTLPPLPPTITP